MESSLQWLSLQDPQGEWPNRQSLRIPKAENLHTLATSASRQPMANRHQILCQPLPHLSPRRPQQIRSGGRPLHNATTDRILRLLEKALNHGRAPHQILSDHGAQFYSDYSPSQFTEFCENHGIEHIMGSIGKPTTQGKIERFFRTFKAYYPRFNNMPEFLHHYNHVKPHRSLNFLTPAEVCFQ